MLLKSSTKICSLSRKKLPTNKHIYLLFVYSKYITVKRKMYIFIPKKTTFLLSHKDHKQLNITKGHLSVSILSLIQYITA